VNFFSYKAYAFINALSRTQFKHVDICGYGDDVKGYKLWDPTTHIIITKKDVMLDECPLIKSYIVRDERYKA
jgi:hypothetical protein